MSDYNGWSCFKRKFAPVIQKSTIITFYLNNLLTSRILNEDTGGMGNLGFFNSSLSSSLSCAEVSLAMLKNSLLLKASREKEKHIYVNVLLRLFSDLFWIAIDFL